MCKFCERRQDVKFGWNQPKLYEGAQLPLDDHIHGNVANDLEGYIHHYKTTTPILHITSKHLASRLWGGDDGVATIYIPIYHCPICGKQLVSDERRSAIDEQI